VACSVHCTARAAPHPFGFDRTSRISSVVGVGTLAWFLLLLFVVAIKRWNFSHVIRIFLSVCQRLLMTDRKRRQRFDVTDYDSSAWIALAAVALLATVLLFFGAGFLASGHHWLT